MSREPSLNDQFPHVGLAAYFPRSVAHERGTVERVAALLIDRRWPWLPWWASFSGVDKRDDRASVKVGGKNGAAPLVNGMLSKRLTTLYMDRAKGDGNFTSVCLPFDRELEELGAEAPFALWVTCRSAELPDGKRFEDWIALAHELVTAVGALTAHGLDRLRHVGTGGASASHPAGADDSHPAAAERGADDRRHLRIP